MRKDNSRNAKHSLTQVKINNIINCLAKTMWKDKFMNCLIYIKTKTNNIKLWQKLIN